MSNFDLNTFTFNGITLRVVQMDNKTWFPSPDLARCLGLETKTVASNIRRLGDPDGLKVVTKAVDGSSPQLAELFVAKSARVLLVEQSLLLLFLLRAQRSNTTARAFQDWVTKEVLPRIRKDGGYVMGIEKVATGEVTAAQVRANQWKLFQALDEELSASRAALCKSAEEVLAENTAIYEEQQALRDLLRKNEERIEENKRRAGEFGNRVRVVEWQRDRLAAAKLELDKVANPGDYGMAA